MKKLYPVILIVFGVVFLNNCGSLKNLIKNDSKKSDKIIIPIHKVWDDENYYYSFGMGESKDLQLARDKAAFESRDRLAKFLSGKKKNYEYELKFSEETELKILKPQKMTKNKWVVAVVIRAPKKFNKKQGN